MKKLWKIILYIFISIVILLSILIWIIIVSFSWDHHLKYLQSVENKNLRYSLYSEAWFQDKLLFVMKHNITDKSYKEIKVINDIIRKEKSWVILENWNDWCNYENPNIFIFNEKYLIFERWNLYHSLYDLDTHELLIHHKNSELEYEKFWYEDKFNCEDHFLNWKKENLHNKIFNVINR